MGADEWQRWNNMRLHPSRPGIEFDGTNNAIERGIGRSKMRQEAMRSRKSLEKG